MSLRNVTHRLIAAPTVCVVAFLALCFSACVRKITVAPVKPFHDTVSLPQQSLPQLPILAYHRVHPTASNHMVVSPDLLRAHLTTLRQHGFSFISLDHWFAALHGQAQLPPKPVVLSFDDGWRDQYLYALPILEEFNAPAIFYVATATLGSDETMTWDQLSDLARRGHLIGCHSATHSDLARPFSFESPRRYAARLHRETAGARATLASHLHHTINHFCYPYGYYNSNLLAFIRNAGFLSAATVNPVANDPTTHPLLLGRFIVAPWTTPEALLASLSARRLSAATVPPDAAMPHSPTTCVIVHLPHDAPQFLSVRMKWNWRWTDAYWDPATRTVRLPFQHPLPPGIYSAQVHAWDAHSNHYVAAWLFHQTPSQSPPKSSHLAQLQGR